MQNFDVVIIGAGPGGYVAAIRCSQLGLKTAVIEREYLGGVCLNVGCIPSKAMISATHLLHKAQHQFAEMGLNIKGPIEVDMKQLLKWKDSVCDKMSGGVTQLLKGNRVTVIKGEAHFINSRELSIKLAETSPGKGQTETVSAKYFIVATGSRPIEISGFKFDEKEILSSTGALDLDHIPKRVAVIGGGYIGLEISTYLRKLGCEITILEAQNNLLAGVVDPECAQVVTKKLEGSGVKILFGAKAKSQRKLVDGIELTYERLSGAPGASAGASGNAGVETKIKVDKILVTVGRRPNSDQLNLKAAGVLLDEKGFISVNPQRKTSVPHIYAIGDIAGQPMLAHKASYEGVLVAEVIGAAHTNRAYDVKVCPAVVFTDPEIASAGLTETEARAKGYQQLLVSKFPFAANGRAVSMMETEGFVKMVADGKTHVLLGVHIVGPEASNLISEAALAIEMGSRLEDLALTIHPHPTLGETVMEAAEATLGHAIHIIQRPLKQKEVNAKI